MQSDVPVRRSLSLSMRAVVLTCSTGLLGLGVLAGASCVDASGERRPWHDWSTLRLKAKSTLFRGQVEMRLVDGPSGRRLETSTQARFFGAIIARSDTTTSFDATGKVREYVSYSRKRGRRYTFGDAAYTVDKLRPREDEDEAAEDPWQISSHKEFTNPAAGEDGGVEPLFDYYGMLLHLRGLDLGQAGDEVELHVATSEGPKPYRIHVAERRQAERQFIDLATGEKKTLPTQELKLTIMSADPEAEGGFLNMVGETEVWVEAESKTVLEIGGNIPKVPGRVRLVLAAMG